MRICRYDVRELQDAISIDCHRYQGRQQELFAQQHRGSKLRKKVCTCEPYNLSRLWSEHESTR